MCPSDASAKWVVIGLGNGLLPFYSKGIGWTNDALQLNHKKQTYLKNLDQYTNIFFKYNAYQNAISKMITIMLLPWWAKAGIDV